MCTQCKVLCSYYYFLFDFFFFFSLVLVDDKMRASFFYCLTVIFLCVGRIALLSFDWIKSNLNNNNNNDNCNNNWQNRNIFYAIQSEAKQHKKTTSKFTIDKMKLWLQRHKCKMQCIIHISERTGEQANKWNARIWLG